MNVSVRIFLCSSVISITILLLNEAEAASFDCSKASSEVEKMVCADDELLSLDERLSVEYLQAKQRHNNLSQLKKEQLYWLQEELRQCKHSNCVRYKYKSRIYELGFNCKDMRNRFDAIACDASTEKQLEQFIEVRMTTWGEYFDKREKQWYGHAVGAWKELQEKKNKMYEDGVVKCLTFECKQAVASMVMERILFPNEAYVALFGWVRAHGADSEIVLSDDWRIKDPADVWGVVNNKIHRIRISYSLTDAWFDYANEQRPAPPFLDRPLTTSEIFNLHRMVSSERLSRWTRGVNNIAGINQDVWRSVYFHDGGSAQCSQNPLNSAIYIRSVTAGSSDGGLGEGYKIIEISDEPVKQKTPLCIFKKVDTHKIFKNEESYKTRVLIDGVGGLFVRPDGMFWLKLSDGFWHRFGRNMKSSSPSIGTRYFVISKEKFESYLDSSDNLQQLEENLIGYVAALKKHHLSDPDT